MEISESNAINLSVENIQDNNNKEFKKLHPESVG